MRARAAADDRPVLRYAQPRIAANCGRGLPATQLRFVRVRIRTLLLLAYLASPIDLIPDFIPIIGYADDAIISYLVLRRILRAAGPDVIRQHWAGSPEGLTAVQRLLGTD